MVWKPHVTVAAVIEGGGRYLMVEESIDGQLRLNQPAGHLEENETPVQAVIREVREETGHHFEPRGLVGVYLWRQPKGKTFLRLTFHGPATEPAEPVALDPDIDRALWLTPDEIRAREDQWRSPMVGRCLEEYLAGLRFPLALLREVTESA